MGVRSASSAQHSVLVTHSYAIAVRGREGKSCCAVISISCWNKHTAVFQSFGSHSSASDQTFSVCSKLTFFTKHFGNGVVYLACPVFHQFIPSMICHKFWIHVLCSNLSSLFKYLPPQEKVNKSLERHEEMLSIVKADSFVDFLHRNVECILPPITDCFLLFSCATDEADFERYTTMFLSHLV